VIEMLEQCLSTAPFTVLTFRDVRTLRACASDISFSKYCVAKTSEGRIDDVLDSCRRKMVRVGIVVPAPCTIPGHEAFQRSSVRVHVWPVLLDI
jgi:hypothetical protein